jgi:hypothetical protein
MVRLTRNPLENVGVFFERNAMESRCGFVDAIADTMYLARDLRQNYPDSAEGGLLCVRN